MIYKWSWLARYLSALLSHFFGSSVSLEYFPPKPIPLQPPHRFLHLRRGKFFLPLSLMKVLDLHKTKKDLKWKGRIRICIKDTQDPERIRLKMTSRIRNINQSPFTAGCVVATFEALLMRKDTAEYPVWMCLCTFFGKKQFQMPTSVGSAPANKN